MVKNSHGCSYINCNNNTNSHKDLAFFKFPVHEVDRCLLWQKNCANQNIAFINRIQLTYKRVCEKHFSSKDIGTSGTRKVLTKAAIPLPPCASGSISKLTRLSGRMPFRCCVPQCRGNLNNGPKVHIFRFPLEVQLRQKWISAMNRHNFVPTGASRVCHLHFRKEDLQWETSVVDDTTGHNLVARLMKPRLTAGAVPTIFPDNFHLKKFKATLEINKFKKEMHALTAAVEKNLEEEQRNKDKFAVNTFEDLKAKIYMLEVKDKWTVILGTDYITIIYIDYTKQPHDIVYVYINLNLNLRVYRKGVEIDVHNVSHTNIDSVLKLQDALDNIDEYVINPTPDIDENLMLLGL